MGTDIREQRYVEHRDVVGLNFIRGPNRFVFRRYYRQGLRSHVMEVLDPADVRLESTGVLRGQSRWFPKASPLKVLRIFRTKFSTWQEAYEDIKRFQIIKSFLAADYLAVSEEFIAEYTGSDTHRIILCGLQEFVTGEVLDPWALTGECLLEKYNPCLLTEAPEIPARTWVRRVQLHAGRFVDRVRAMIVEAHLVPDLAGVGNLLLSPDGVIKLVDINNICPVDFEAPPLADERGYPTCDKSIEALSRIETHLLGKTVRSSDPIYHHFLTPDRMRAVADMGKAFHAAI
ncbi:MAG: hypothetical protein V2B19_13505 [Pseudomonadota bacterium]